MIIADKLADWLKDLDKYSEKLADGAVVAYPVEKSRAKRGWGERDMEFTIKAQVLKAKPGVVDEPAEEPKKAEQPEAEETKTQESKKDEL